MQILEELELSTDPFYTLNETLKGDIQELIASNPSETPGPASLTLGQGQWQVFHAPHIVNLSSSFGARFDPILYRLDGNKLYSNVRYSHPVLGSGWLSASGAVQPLDIQLFTFTALHSLPASPSVLLFSKLNKMFFWIL